MTRSILEMRKLRLQDEETLLKVMLLVPTGTGTRTQVHLTSMPVISPAELSKPQASLGLGTWPGQELGEARKPLGI